MKEAVLSEGEDADQARLQSKIVLNKNMLVDFDVRGQHVKDFLPEEAFLWIRTPILDLFLTNTRFFTQQDIN